MESTETGLIALAKFQNTTEEGRYGGILKPALGLTEKYRCGHLLATSTDRGENGATKDKKGGGMIKTEEIRAVPGLIESLAHPV